MKSNKYAKGFIPYILMLFLNSMTDLGHKIVIQNSVFKIYDGSEQIVLTAIINLFILLPYVALFSPVGFIADKYPKEKVMKISSFFAVIVTFLIGFSYYFGCFWGAFGLTLILATQSAIYSPAKYGYIRELLGDSKTAIGNSWVQATTIIAILGGTFLYSVLFESFLEGYETKSDILKQMVFIAFILFTSSIIEFYLSFKLPNRRETDQKKRFIFKKYIHGDYFRNSLNTIFREKEILKAIILIALFFGISQVLLVIFGAFVKANLGETNTIIVQGLMALSGIGIVIGSFIAGKISKSSVELGVIPIGFLGAFIFVGIMPFLNSATLFAIDFLFFGIFGGFIIVPLSAFIQLSSKLEKMGSVLASNNFIQNIFMVSFLGLTTIFALFEYNEIYIFYILSGISVVGVVLSLSNYFQDFVIFLTRILFFIKYSIHNINDKNLSESSKNGVLFVSNHVSWIDWAVVGLAVRRVKKEKLLFLMDKNILNSSFILKFFLTRLNVLPVSPRDFKDSFEKSAEALRNGQSVIIFAEGYITFDGQLSSLKRGYTRIIDLLSEEEKKSVFVMPLFIEGLWGSYFSRASKITKRLNRRKFRRDVFVSFGKAIRSDKHDEILPENLTQRMRETSIFAWEKYISAMDFLSNEWIRQAKKDLNKTIIYDGVMNTQLKNGEFMTAVFLFANLIKKLSSEQNIGTILPASSGTAITNMAVLYLGKTVVNLNFTASQDLIVAGMKSASIESIYTSRTFINILKDKGVILDEVLKNANVYYLEDMKKKIKPHQKIATFLKIKLLPTCLLKQKYSGNLENPATIIFSSGSENKPKGIILTHRNILTNVVQSSHLLNFNEEDKIFSILPVFHSFGFTVTTILPLLKSVPMVTFGNPTDATGIAQISEKYKPNIIFATSTIYRIYLRSNRVKPEVFKNYRYVIAGAEKLNSQVREGFETKFNQTILEGYGVTETSPVSGVNLPKETKLNPETHLKNGTVGKALVGTVYKIIDPETLEELPFGTDGMITIAGHQLMKEYLNNPEKTNSVIFEKDEIRYYMTGDKGHLDKNGFLSIIDRYSRFVKIGGEMVSLSSASIHIDNALNQANLELEKDIEFLLIGISNSKKGEKIVMLINQEVHNLKHILLEEKINHFFIPSDIFVVAKIPMLGSGKPNFKEGKELAQKLLNK